MVADAEATGGHNLVIMIILTVSAQSSLTDKLETQKANASDLANILKVFPKTSKRPTQRSICAILEASIFVVLVLQKNIEGL
jgi:hypothetical protein